MTLATKNGALIVKDGALAENCNCCGEWYCCISANDSPCAIDDVVQSITVDITTGDDQIVVGDRVLSNYACNAGDPTVTLYSRNVAIIPASLYAGSFSLTRQSANSWTYAYSPDTPGNIATITAMLIAGIWQVELAFTSYTWRKTSRSPITDSKTLAEMPKFSGGDPQPCYFTDEQLFFVRGESFGVSFPAGYPCANRNPSASSTAPLQSYTFINEWSGYSTSSQSGANSISLTASIVTSL